MKLIVSVIFIASFVVALGERARFDNYRVYSIYIENEGQLQALHDLEMFPDGTSFIESPNAIHQTAELVVPPHKFADISEFLNDYEFKNHIKTKNLQE